MTSPSTPPPRMNSAFKQFRFLHWFMAIGYGILVLLGLFLAKVFEQGAIHDGLYLLHSTLGILAIASLILRLGYLLHQSWQRYSRRLPRVNSTWLQSFVLHTLFYLLMVAIPLTGIGLVNSFASGNVVFLVWKLPDLFPQNPDLGETLTEWHGHLAFMLVVLTGIHLIFQRKTVQKIWKRWFQGGQSA